MDQFISILAIICGLITLVVFIATSVWAVAQIKETTSSLAIEIKNLSTSVDKMAIDFDRIDERLRAVENRH